MCLKEHRFLYKSKSTDMSNPMELAGFKYSKEEKSIESKKLMKGKEFKKIKLWKILHDDLKHQNYQYVEGLNLLDQKFKPFGECEDGGLYITWEPENYIDYGTKIAAVTLPDDALVWTEGNKAKVNKLILGKPFTIAKLILDLDKTCTNRDEILQIIIKYDPLISVQIKNKSNNICNFIRLLNHPEIEEMSSIPGFFYFNLKRQIRERPSNLYLDVYKTFIHSLNLTI